MPTVGEFYNAGIDRLMAAGYDRHEARVAVGVILDSVTRDRHAHLLRPDQVVDNAAEAKLQCLLNDLEAGRPLCYLLKECEFFGHSFVCDERALIPRGDTETLVEAAVARLGAERTVKMADLGTGTGCIAVSIALSLPEAIVYATDTSEASLSLCGQNVAKANVANRVTLVRGHRDDWAGPLLEMGLAGALNAIVSNPPYIPSAEIETLQPQIRDHEPRGALDGGDDGLCCYRQIADQCGALLAPGGFIMVELGAGQFRRVSQIFRDSGWRVEKPILDLGRIERVLVATR